MAFGSHLLFVGILLSISIFASAAPEETCKADGSCSATPSVCNADSCGTSGFAEKHTKHKLTAEPWAMIERDFLKRRGMIVATTGPATDVETMYGKLIKAGVNIFRLNSSHRRKGEFEYRIKTIRAEAKAAGKKVLILGDLQGPKFRCTMTVNDAPFPLERDAHLELGLAKDESDLTRPGRIVMAKTKEQVAMLRGLKVGMQILIDDGAMVVEVTDKKDDSEMTVKVVVEGQLESKKGMNVPEMEIETGALTVKDKEDADFLIENGVDFLALSFVQKGADIQELIDIYDAKKLPADRRPLIIPKIEKPAALKNIDEILALSDGLMVARGDLGVELGLERVPFAQKFLIRKANAARKLCITATQMMETMKKAAVPTRAEVSDVAGAIFDGTDAVMLSAESSMGHDPVRTVEWMGKIVAEAEAHVNDIAPSF